MRRTITVGVGALLLVGLLGACGASAPPRSRSAGEDDDDSTAGGKSGGMLRVVWAEEAKFRECYDEARRAKPDLIMRVSLIMSVTGEGRVDRVSLTAAQDLDAKLKECVTGVAQAIRFPGTGKAFTLRPAVVFRP
ncbi:MAG TPA: hypothetical protein VGQ83_28975 [Polyangia bacterium]|jgi:hypothetical protein